MSGEDETRPEKTSVAAATPGTIPARRVASPRAVLGVASLGVVLAFIDATIVNIAFPDIRDDFPDTSLDGLSWVLNAYNIVFAAFLVAAGRIADLLGRRKMFAFGVLLFTVASGLCAAAPSVETLVAARVVQALGAAIVVPASLALVLDAYGTDRRTEGVTLWTASAVVAAGIGPSLGGLLVDLGGWRLAFLVNLPVGVVALALSGRALVESRAPGRRRVPDLFGALLLAAGTALLVLGIVQGESWGWSDARVLGAFAVAAALIALFAWRSARHRSPMLDLDLLRIRPLAIANVLTIVAGAGFFAYTLCNVLFLTTVWDYSVLDAGLALTPGPLVAAIVARPAGHLADRLGEGPLLVAGGLVWAAGLLYLARLVGTSPEFLAEWLPGMAILGLGAGITFPVAGAAAVTPVPGERFATASGLSSVSRQLGAALGVALLVAIIGTPSPAEIANAFDRGWYFGMGCFLLVAAGALSLGRIERPVEEREPEPEAARPPVRPRAPRPRDATPASATRGSAPITAADALGHAPTFADLSAAARRRLADSSSDRSLRAGEWLFRQGDPPDHLYVVVSGRLEAVREGDDDDDVLNVLGPGAVIGELAVIAGNERSASIRARRDSRLIQLERSEFDRFFDEEPDVRRALMATMARQLQKSRAIVPAAPQAPSTLALLPLHAGLPVEEVTRLLVDALSAHGAVARLDGPRPEAEAGEMLERQERDSDHVLLVGSEDGVSDPWSAFCLRQADRVLALAGDASIPGEVAADPRLQGCDLLFCLREPGTMVPWLDALEPRARYALRPDALGASLEAAARRLVGRSVGLVLSGGGARAFGHIGVIQELEAAGVIIDRVAAVSFGAFVGGMFAAGMGAEEIDARCYEEWVRRNPLSDYRFPRYALIRGEKARAMLHRNLPGLIEELPRDFACTAADLHTGEEVVFRRGSLAEEVGASLCLPGIAPPERLSARLLVDGVLINALPLHLLDHGEGPRIASDATAGHAEDGEPSDKEPGARHGDAQERPRIAETMFRTVFLGGIEATRAARRRADLLIVPPSAGVGLLEWHQLDRVKEAGRRAAAEALESAPTEIFA